MRAGGRAGGPGLAAHGRAGRVRESRRAGKLRQRRPRPCRFWGRTGPEREQGRPGAREQPRSFLCMAPRSSSAPSPPCPAGCSQTTTSRAPSAPGRRRVCLVPPTGASEAEACPQTRGSRRGPPASPRFPSTADEHRAPADGAGVPGPGKVSPDRLGATAHQPLRKLAGWLPAKGLNFLSKPKGPG